jgi:hypothetical protein
MYGPEVNTKEVGCAIRQLTLTERLKEQRDHHAAKLEQLNAAIAALEANPQVQSVLDLIQKVSHL